MELGKRFLGDPHNDSGHEHGEHGHEHGGLIRRARLYEVSAAIAFVGSRPRIYDGLVALSGAKPGDRVLDVGCGTGYLARRAARAVSPDGVVVGVDPSRPVVEYASRAGSPRCTFLVAGAEALPQPDASFDVVMSSLAIHHVPFADRPTALREMHRVLCPGGRLFVADFRPPRNRLANHLIGVAGGHAMQHNPIRQLAELVGEAGFEIIDSGDRRPWLHYVQARRPLPEQRRIVPAVPGDSAPA